MIFCDFTSSSVVQKNISDKKIIFEMYYINRKHHKTTESSVLTKWFQPVRLDIHRAKTQKTMIFDLFYRSDYTKPCTNLRFRLPRGFIGGATPIRSSAEQPRLLPLGTGKVNQKAVARRRALNQVCKPHFHERGSLQDPSKTTLIN